MLGAVHDLTSTDKSLNEQEAGVVHRTTGMTRHCVSDDDGPHSMPYVLEEVDRGGQDTTIGYRNICRLQNGREVRTVEIDPMRGLLMKWAFESYATGAWSVRRLCRELNNRGIETMPGPMRPSKPIYQSLLHMRLRDPYYKGLVRYRGVEYPGSHEPLVTPYVERGGDIHADLAEPFDTLLGSSVRDLPMKPDGRELDWKTWEESLNENTHEEDLVGVSARTRGPGLNYDILVGATGLEP
jgi:hypothetical protein